MTKEFSLKFFDFTHLELLEENINYLYNFGVDMGILSKIHTHTNTQKLQGISRKLIMKKRAFIKAKMTNLEEA